MLTLAQKIVLVDRALHEGLSKDSSGEATVSASWVQTLVPGVPSYVANRVVRSVLDAHEADARIAATMEMYRAHRLPLQWVLGPEARPLDLGERLIAAGFRLAHVAAGMFAHTDQICVEPTPGVTVDEIDERSLGEWLELQATGWRIPPPEVERLRAQASRRLRSGEERTVYLIARLGGVPAAAAAIDLHEGFAHLLKDVVLPEHRRQGVYRGLNAARVAILKARGVQAITVHALKDTSAPILEAIGFERVCDILYYERAA